MPSLPRGICPTCYREVALRKGGLVREHLSRRLRRLHSLHIYVDPCPGSGQPSVESPGLLEEAPR
jgi:hypothetical protein